MSRPNPLTINRLAAKTTNVSAIRLTSPTYNHSSSTISAGWRVAAGNPWIACYLPIRFNHAIRKNVTGA